MVTLCKCHYNFLSSSERCSAVSYEKFRPRGDSGGEGRRESRGRRELNYFVELHSTAAELEGEKVIDKVVPLHLAAAALRCAARRFYPGKGFSSVGEKTAALEQTSFF